MGTEKVDVAPEIAEAPPEEEGVLGVLTPEERGKLNQMQHLARETVFGLGELEVQKSRLVTRLSLLESQNQDNMREIGERLGLDPETKWQVGADGKVRIVPA